MDLLKDKQSVSQGKGYSPSVGALIRDTKLGEIISSLSSAIQIGRNGGGICIQIYFLSSIYYLSGFDFKSGYHFGHLST